MKLRSATLDVLEQCCEPATGEETGLMTEDAFADFYNKTIRPLRVYLARASGSDALAEDLAQESYIRFLCARAPWDEGETACRRYLFRIGTNLLRDHWRRPKTDSLENHPDLDLASSEPPAIDRIDSSALVAAAFTHLKPLERQLLWLAYAEGMSHREISDITRLGAARIRLTLFRVRSKFEKVLRREMMLRGVE